MPYLQLDIPKQASLAEKRALAKRMGEIYSEVMQISPHIISVAIREIGAGGLWRCSDGEPDEAALLMLDVRRGRPLEVRAELARQLIAACVQMLGLKENRLNVEFTQHDGDEMYHPLLGGFNQNWVDDERPRG